jgi:nucleoside triphosphatase
MTSPQKPSLQKNSITQVFPEPTVGALIVNDEGKILLAKSHKWYDKYTLPGGHVEVGESMVDALQREVKEEVGLDVEVVEMLLIQEAIFAPEFYKKKHFIFIDFYCKSKNQQVKLDHDEIQGYVWVYPGAAYNLKLDSFTRKALDRFLERNTGSFSRKGLQDPAFRL